VVQSLPGVRIAVPAGEAETREVIRIAAAGDRPCYVRLARNDVFEIPLTPAGRGAVSWLNPLAGDSCLVSIGEKPTELCLAATQQRPDVGHAHLCWVDAESLAGVVPQLAAARRLVVVEEHRAAGSVAATLALMLPGREVHSVNAGLGWPSEGGSHDEVLAALGLTVSAVLQAV
jgi:transketolase